MKLQALSLQKKKSEYVEIEENKFNSHLTWNSEKRSEETCVY
jgi:hypothetical protein